MATREQLAELMASLQAAQRAFRAAEHARTVTLAARNDAILAAANAGFVYDDLAALTGLSEPRIAQIVTRGRSLTD